MKRFIAGMLAFFALQGANASPLTLYYQVMGSGSYHYDFQLVLDNHDNSWVPGRSFNLIVFGDVVGFENNSDSAFGPFGSFVFDPLDGNSGPFEGGNLMGYHNGPVMIDITHGMPEEAGWIPAAPGDFVSWGGTAPVSLGQGDLLWSQLYGTSPPAELEVAVLLRGEVSEEVPEPMSVALMGIGLFGFFASRRRSK